MSNVELKKGDVLVVRGSGERAVVSRSFKRSAPVCLKGHTERFSRADVARIFPGDALYTPGPGVRAVALSADNEVLAEFDASLWCKAVTEQGAEAVGTLTNFYTSGPCGNPRLLKLLLWSKGMRMELADSSAS